MCLLTSSSFDVMFDLEPDIVHDNVFLNLRDARGHISGLERAEFACVCSLYGSQRRCGSRVLPTISSRSSSLQISLPHYGLLIDERKPILRNFEAFKLLRLLLLTGLQDKLIQ